MHPHFAPHAFHFTTDACAELTETEKVFQGTSKFSKNLEGFYYFTTPHQLGKKEKPSGF
jgi:hypothetical protein